MNDTANLKKPFWLTNLVAFISISVAAALAFAANEWFESDAAVWVLAILGLVFVTALLTLTSIASFADTLPGNTFSELIRESTVNTTFYPWALAVYMGRWFHPVDDLDSPLGIWGPILLMVTTWLMVGLGSLLAQKGTRPWPWLVVTLGFAVGIIAWPS